MHLHKHLLTYAGLSLRGVKKILSPGDAVDTKGATEGYGSGEIHRMCSSWHCLRARHSCKDQQVSRMEFSYALEYIPLAEAHPSRGLVCLVEQPLKI